jgi:hypothetical protein
MLQHLKVHFVVEDFNGVGGSVHVCNIVTPFDSSPWSLVQIAGSNYSEEFYYYGHFTVVPTSLGIVPELALVHSKKVSA